MADTVLTAYPLWSACSCTDVKPIPSSSSIRHRMLLCWKKNSSVMLRCRRVQILNEIPWASLVIQRDLMILLTRTYFYLVSVLAWEATNDYMLNTALTWTLDSYHPTTDITQLKRNKQPMRCDHIQKYQCVRSVNDRSTKHFTNDTMIIINIHSATILDTVWFCPQNLCAQT